jgi:hypothetical protein
MLNKMLYSRNVLKIRIILKKLNILVIWKAGLTCLTENLIHNDIFYKISLLNLIFWIIEILFYQKRIDNLIWMLIRLCFLILNISC